jgi:hypothetical protein
MAYLLDLEGELLADLRTRSRNLLYQQDPVAWLWDVLGKRWWSKQEEIAWSFWEHDQTLVKSCNGVGKSYLGADLVTWFATVHPPQETSVMVSAPVRNQIDEVMFRYLRENYGEAAARNTPFVGEITRFPKWHVDEPYDIDLVVPRRPSDQNLLSAFQGVHNVHVAVVLDEAGGLQEDFFIGANAVTTNDDAHILGIGNPDRRNTAFHKRFKDRISFADWHIFTIRADDSPNFTGEVIYPDDPEKDALAKSKLVKVSWAAMMRRSALPGVVKAKVDGEFPDEDDTTFFAQDAINRAYNTDLTPKAGTPARRTLGVDLAFSGEDKSVAYLNVGGHIRKVDEWNRTAGVEHMQSATRIHELAKKHEADEVRVDAAGTGAGVYSNLKTEDRFADRRYILIGVLGANRSPNSNRWLNARAWHYDTFRRRMNDGLIDLDMNDTELRTDMEAQWYKITRKSQLQITSKQEQKAHGLHSPDHLDAAIYSDIDMTAFVDTPGAGAEDADTAIVDPWQMAALTAVGMPI